MNGRFIPTTNEKQRLSSLMWLVPLAAGLGLAGFLAFSAQYYHTGFPLDDAWIHQTYARNLALRGEWAFLPGQPSAGSTSPLWSLLLAAGYLIGWMPHGWTFLLGGVCLAGLALAGELAFRAGFPFRAGLIPWMGLFLAFEWHLDWAAASGMETALYAAMLVAVMAVLFSPRPSWLLVGGLTGLAVWVRPDGITLLGPILFVLFFDFPTWRKRLAGAGKVLAAFLLFFLPYLIFNHSLAGSWWPNTFYAKQAEYAILVQTPLIARIFSLLKLPLVGAGAVLAPGVAYALWRGWTHRRWPVLAAFLWWLGYTGLYALRLPVVYQHGRYLMPSMPVFFLLGLLGMAEFLKMGQASRWARLLGKAWALSAGLVLFIFYGMGAFAYAQDVAIIETEMVTTARWTAQNTPPDATIAAHDIGALGYFGQRKLLDLAGLISPEVIPFIRDEDRLARYLDEQHADYLITFPGWYPQLVRRGTLVFQTGGKISPQLGGENMAVYRWTPQP